MEVVNGEVNISLKDFREMEDFIKQVKASKSISISDGCHYGDETIRFYSDEELTQEFKQRLESLESSKDYEIEKLLIEKGEYQKKYYEEKTRGDAAESYSIFKDMGFWEIYRWIKNYKK